MVPFCREKNAGESNSFMLTRSFIITQQLISAPAISSKHLELYKIYASKGIDSHKHRNGSICYFRSRSIVTIFEAFVIVHADRPNTIAPDYCPPDHRQISNGTGRTNVLYYQNISYKYSGKTMHG